MVQYKMRRRAWVDERGAWSSRWAGHSLHTHTHVRTHTRKYNTTHMYAQYIHTNIHTCIDIHMHARIHLHMCIHSHAVRVHRSSSWRCGWPRSWRTQTSRPPCARRCPSTTRLWRPWASVRAGECGGLTADATWLTADATWLTADATWLTADASWITADATWLTADASWLTADATWLTADATWLTADATWLRQRGPARRVRLAAQLPYMLAAGVRVQNCWREQ